MEGFRHVREHEHDELERWRMETSVERAQEPDAETEDAEAEVVEDAPDEPAAGDETPQALSPEDRAARIRALLQQPAQGTVDDLPAGLLDLFTDEGQLRLLEEKLTPDTPFLETANAIKAITMLADWEWSDRVIKSPTTVSKLTAFYEQTEDRTLRTLMIAALFRFGGPEIPFEFILTHLRDDHVQLKAAILGDLQFYVDKPYLRELVTTELLPLLHAFCEYPLREAVYSDDWHGEADFRVWVFRCLGGIKSADSAPVIEKYLETHDWPIETLAEAANAHWDITGSTRYLPILRRAEAEEALGNTEHALREMEQHLDEHGADEDEP
jgi:hypothetical protein